MGSGIQTKGMAGVGMSEQLNRIEELRLAAIAKDRVEQFDEALALFDEALSLAADEETRELITINKAHAMIGAQRGGPEVQALPLVLMRRRNPRHTFLAAYALLYKHRLSGEAKRSGFPKHTETEAGSGNLPPIGIDS